jgi:hypothetical protein
MKAAMVVICVLAFAVFVAHSDVSPVHLESSAPSIEIVFTGQGSDPSIGAFYHFAVRNHSSHGVTGFHVYQIPDSVQKTDGKYACNSACSGTSLLGDKSDPMIKPGEAFDLHVPLEDAAKWPTLWADAAIFDNYTYEGDEKIAARLGVEQIGNQAEFDRVKPLLDAVSADSSTADSAKGESLKSQISALPTTIEPQMIQRFNFWFPNLPDCDHEYARLMSGASAAARDVIERDLDKFNSGAYTGMSFSQWIEKTNEYLSRAHIGCSKCGVLPTSASNAATAFVACPVAPANAANVTKSN